MVIASTLQPLKDILRSFFSVKEWARRMEQENNKNIQKLLNTLQAIIIYLAKPYQSQCIVLLAWMQFSNSSVYVLAQGPVGTIPSCMSCNQRHYFTSDKWLAAYLCHNALLLVQGSGNNFITYIKRAVGWFSNMASVIDRGNGLDCAHANCSCKSRAVRLGPKQWGINAFLGHIELSHGSHVPPAAIFLSWRSELYRQASPCIEAIMSAFETMRINSRAETKNSLSMPCLRKAQKRNGRQIYDRCCSAERDIYGCINASYEWKYFGVRAG